jgi:hypothetical protein
VDLPSPSVLAEASVCPTCDGEFQLLNGQRWCLRCGYCVDTELAPKVEEEPKPPPPTVPEWLNFLGAGCVLIGTATVALGLLLSPGSVLLMVWIGVQAALGILGYFVGHLRLVGGTAVDENESKEPLAMNPVAVWRRAIHDLPQTLWPLCCAGWGVTALVCAIVLALVKY